jgi:serine protease Do
MALATTVTLVVALSLVQAAIPTPSEMGRSVAPLVEAVKDSVVTIRSIKVISRAVREDPITQFFRERFGLGTTPRGRSETQQGLGSGFIVDAKKGVVLTNNHVVAGADEVQVVTSDHRVLDARVEGSDPGTDVAVVRLLKPPPGLKVARLGNSEKVRVGDYVLAIGNPLGLGQTVTMGIVSAKNRTLDGRLVDFADFIQTDAAINQGNSGGPLFNFAGEVIGINSAILNPAVAMNVGFAIPINLARNIADQILTKGQVARGYLGVLSEPLPADLARRLGLSEGVGVLVNSVEPKSPAQAAGLKSNDVIVEVAGRAVLGAAGLTQIVASRSPGDVVPLVILRGGRRVTLEATLKEAVHLRGEKVLGMQVQRLTPQESAALELPGGSGVRVLGIDPRGPVSGYLREGDVIVVIVTTRRQAATIEALRGFAQRLARGGRGQMVVMREGQPFVLNF